MFWLRIPNFVFLVTHVSHYMYVTSLTSGSYDPLNILDTIGHVKVGERALVDGTRASVSTHQPSEQGYLKLTSPSVSPGTKGTVESSTNSDQVWEVGGCCLWLQQQRATSEDEHQFG